jgi:hypothetical protein
MDFWGLLMRTEEMRVALAVALVVPRADEVFE